MHRLPALNSLPAAPPRSNSLPALVRIERDLYERYDQFGVELRERAKWDIREGIVGAEAFTPKHIVITTWKNVSFNGGNSNSRARRVVSPRLIFDADMKLS